MWVSEGCCLNGLGRGVVDLVDLSDLGKGSEDGDWNCEMEMDGRINKLE